MLRFDGVRKISDATTMSTGGIDLNFGHPSASYDGGIGEYFDFGHQATHDFGWDPGIHTTQWDFVGSPYAVHAYQAAPAIDLNAHDGIRRPASRAKYAAMVGAGAVALGLGITKWQATPKDDKSRASAIASDQPTRKAEAVKSAAQG